MEKFSCFKENPLKNKKYSRQANKKKGNFYEFDFTK